MSTTTEKPVMERAVKRTRTDYSRAKQLNLHLGCGPKRLENFVNIDILAHDAVDIVSDLRVLSGFQDQCARLIYASHVLEHFGRWEVDSVLAEWTRLLQPGGELRLAVPDFAKCAKLYYERGLENGLSGLVGLIVGGQRDSYDYHKSVFDFDLLASILTKAGLHKVERWDWRCTDHSSVDDYSQSYLPHMDKDNGALMSLNIRAFKP